MGIPDILLMLLGLLIYSGPLVPLVATLLFKRASHEHFRRNAWALVFLCGIQAISFLPLVFAVAAQKPESYLRLYIPFGVGVLMLFGTSVYAVFECAHLRSLLHSRNDA